MKLRTTHTLVELPLSPGTYAEIADALRAAGYAHVFLGGRRIDMTGIAVTEIDVPFDDKPHDPHCPLLHGDAEGCACKGDA